jgi:hypothetical protein
MFNALKALFSSNKEANVSALGDGQSFSIYDQEGFRSRINVNVIVSADADFSVHISNPSCITTRKTSEVSFTRTKDVPVDITVKMSILPKLLGFQGDMDVCITNKNNQHPSKFFSLNASSAKVQFITGVNMTEVKLHMSQDAEVMLSQEIKEAYHQVVADMNDSSTLCVKADIRGLKVELRDETCLDLTQAGTIGAKVIHYWNERNTTVKE